MKKHWTELTKECDHEVSKMRHAFLLEHQKADQIVCNNNGVPLQAIYFTPEMPGYVKTYDEVKMFLPHVTTDNPKRGEASVDTWTFRIDKLYDCSLRMTPVADDDVEVLVLKSAYDKVLIERDEYAAELIGSYKAMEFVTNTLAKERDALKAELADYKSFITNLARHVIPGELDSIDRLTEIIREHDELIAENSRLKETLSHLPKVPTEPYEKAMAKEITRLRETLELHHRVTARMRKESE